MVLSLASWFFSVSIAQDFVGPVAPIFGFHYNYSCSGSNENVLKPLPSIKLVRGVYKVDDNNGTNCEHGCCCCFAPDQGSLTPVSVTSGLTVSIHALKTLYLKMA